MLAASAIRGDKYVNNLGLEDRDLLTRFFRGAGFLLVRRAGLFAEGAAISTLLYEARFFCGAYIMLVQQI